MSELLSGQRLAWLAAGLLGAAAMGDGLRGATAEAQTPVPDPTIEAPYTYAPGATRPAEITAFVPLVRETWPDSPCKGKETFIITPPEDMHYTDQADGQDKEAWGLADPKSCTFKLSSILHGDQLCEVEIHETGHGNQGADYPGPEHSSDPKDIMYAHYTGTYGPCDRLTTDTERQSYKDLAKQAVAKYLPDDFPECQPYPKKPSSQLCSQTQPLYPIRYRVDLKSHFTKDGRPQGTVRRIYKRPKWLKAY